MREGTTPPPFHELETYRSEWDLQRVPPPPRHHVPTTWNAGGGDAAGVSVTVAHAWAIFSNSSSITPLNRGIL